MRKATGLLAITALALAHPAANNGPTVDIRNGTLVGSTSDDVDSFNGIPYVQPPVKQLRLRPPQSINKPFGTLKLTANGSEVAACIQMYQSQPDAAGLSQTEVTTLESLRGSPVGISGEDCLFVNIQRPSNMPHGTKLPVLFWIYGGGYEIGTTQWYDATKIVQKSVSMGEPILFVQPNYRLNAYGFLNGRQLQEAGATNLGLRDQRKALEWVAENIEAFGGDPNRVTIWGESAGAMSVFDHMIINKGDHMYSGKALFHGAIMNSGTILHTLGTTNPKAQKVFDHFAIDTGCNPSACGEDVLDCLRKLSGDEFTKAMNSQPNYSGINSNNLAYVRRTDESSDFYSIYPEDALRSGHYAHVPVIAGNLQDEAAPFAVSSRHIVNSTKTLTDYIASWLPDTPRELVSQLIATYPDEPAAGLPAGTGSEYELYPQYKRNAAVQTDLTFEGGRREILHTLSKVVPSWAFIGTFLHGFPQFGTYHTSDLATQFGLSNAIAGNNMDEAYIHFVNSQDPNGMSCDEPWWPKWDSENLRMANFSNSTKGVTRDDYRKDSLDFWRVHGADLRM